MVCLIFREGTSSPSVTRYYPSSLNSDCNKSWWPRTIIILRLVENSRSNNEDVRDVWYVYGNDRRESVDEGGRRQGNGPVTDLPTRLRYRRLRSQSFTGEGSMEDPPCVL